MITFPVQYKGSNLHEGKHKRKSLVPRQEHSGLILSAFNGYESIVKMQTLNYSLKISMKKIHSIITICKIKAVKTASKWSIRNHLCSQMFCHDHPQDGNYEPNVNTFIIRYYYVYSNMFYIMCTIYIICIGCTPNATLSSVPYFHQNILLDSSSIIDGRSSKTSLGSYLHFYLVFSLQSSINNFKGVFYSRVYAILSSLQP